MFTKYISTQIYIYIQIHSCLMPFGLVFPSFPAGTGTNVDNNAGRGYFDPRFKRLLWYLISSTRGGINRAKILDLISSRPSNPNQIGSELILDYKTIVHHLDVLSKNGLIIR